MPTDFNEVDLTARFRSGMRVVVRYRVRNRAGGAAGGVISGSATDALGDVIDVTADTVTVRTRRRGDVRIVRGDIILAKPVPPAPARRGRPHLAIGIDDLQELMVAGMPPLRSEWLGRWLLRSAPDYTGRANSVLPLGDPGLPTSAAVAHVEQWYAALGQPALVQLSGPSGFDPGADPLAAVLLGRDWRIFQRTLVMTADAAAPAASAAAPAGLGSAAGAGSVADAGSAADAGSVAGAGSAPGLGSRVGLETAVAGSPSDAWWAGVSERGLAHRGTFEQMLAHVEQPLYVTVTRKGRTQAIGRVAISAGWAGVFDVQVQSETRRQGLGRLVVATAAAQARAHGIRLMYLQVSEDNEAAVELYRSMGFSIHHEYYYARSHE